MLSLPLKRHQSATALAMSTGWLANLTWAVAPLSAPRRPSPAGPQGAKVPGDYPSCHEVSSACRALGIIGIHAANKAAE
jgi:hypothetical protein